MKFKVITYDKLNGVQGSRIVDGTSEQEVKEDVESPTLQVIDVRSLSVAYRVARSIANAPKRVYTPTSTLLARHEQRLADKQLGIDRRALARENRVKQ